jgi:transposase
MRYELSDGEWRTIRPILPNKARGVPREDDRRVLNGIFWVLRSGAPWRDLPIAFGPYTTSTALCAGVPGSGAGSSRRSLPPMMPPSK